MSNPWEIQTVEYDKTNASGNDNSYGYGQISILLSKYVLKEKGKGLSSNDFTDSDKLKLDSVEVGSQVNKLETLTINNGEKIYPNNEKNINIHIPTKISQLDNDLGYAKLINESIMEDFSDSYVGKSRYAFGDVDDISIGSEASSTEQGIAIGKSSNADGGIALGVGVSTDETHDVNINNQLLHNSEDDIWEGKITESEVAYKNENGTDLTQLDTITDDLTTETQNRIDGDTTLQNNINTEIQNRTNADNGLSNRITSIDNLIPNQASIYNQLADKSFVNSTIQTNTANFRGSWENWSDVPTNSSDYPSDYSGSTTPTVNDYLVIRNASDYTLETLSGTWRFKYVGDWSTDGKSGWIPEYQVNETSFTSEQLYAINSGITATKVSNYDSHLSDTSNPHSVTATQVGLGNVTNVATESTITENSTKNITSGAVYNALSSKVNTNADCWYKYYGQPNGTTRYFTIQTGITYAGIIITTGYNGNIYFDSNKGTPYSFGSSTSYGITGYAWSSDGKTLYIKVSGYRPIAVTIPSIRKSENGTQVIASDWTTTPPSDITFSTTVNQIDTVGDRNTAITDAINNLDVSSVGGSDKYISAISETNGKISATAGNIDTTPTSSSSNLITSGGVYNALQNISAFENSLPNDAYLHYSFDELPDVPDGTYSYRHNKDWTSVDWLRDNTNFTQSIENGCLKWTYNSDTVGNCQANTYWTNPSNKYGLIKLNAKLTNDNTNFTIYMTVDNSFISVISKRLHNGINTLEFSINGTANTYIVMQISNMAQNDSITFEYFYVGDGSDSTPIIDNSGNGYNATNNGVVRAKGMSGKCGYFWKGYSEVPFNIYNNTFSISLWVKPSNETTGKIQEIFRIKRGNATVTSLYNGRNESIDPNIVAFNLNTTSSNTTYHIKNSLLSSTDFTHIVITCSDRLKAYMNGISSESIMYGNIYTNFLGTLYIGNSNNTRAMYLDDLLIFDRVLSENEVKALYNNRGWSPKYILQSVSNKTLYL